MAEPPEIRYVSCGGRDLAYEVIGSGTAGFVVYLECGAHLDLMWTDPAWRQQAERFGELWRAAFFQMRGIGQSEPVERLPTLEEQAQAPRPNAPYSSWICSRLDTWGTPALAAA